MRGRFLAALAIVSGVVLILPAVCLVAQMSCQPAAKASASVVECGVAQAAQALGLACSADDGAKGEEGGFAEAVLGEYGTSVPEGYVEEVLDTAKLQSVKVAHDGAVVGFCMEDDAQEAFEKLAGQLEEKGWTLVESGQSSCGSFVKQGGRYGWLFVSCTDVGSKASAVVLSAANGEGDGS